MTAPGVRGSGSSRSRAGWPAAIVIALAVSGAAPDGFETAQKRLQAALESGQPQAVADAALALAETGDARAVRPLVLVGAQNPGDPVRSAVLQALCMHSEPGWVAALGEQLRASRGDLEAIIAIEALGSIEHASAAVSLAEAFETTRPNILVTVLRAARNHREIAIIEACIDLLERSEAESGLIWAETRITLQAVTGEKYIKAEDWRKWLRTRPEGWRPSGGSGNADGAVTAVYRPGVRDSEGLGLPRIFGQEVASTRVVFVIDTSQSMEKVDPTTAPEEGSAAGSGPTRLARAQKELIGAIEALRPEVRFNIVSYSTGVVVCFPEKLVTAKDSSKRKAVDFVAALKPLGHTNTAEALHTAMDIPEVDTIVFLSDGSPTIPGKGTMAEIPPILESLRVANRSKKITIHTLGFTGALVSFMKEIAAMTGGTYAAVK